MKQVTTIPYLNPQGLTRPIPLERFLPECPAGVVKQYLDLQTKTKNWVLDPFGANPLLDLEMAEAGKKVLVANNNPILVLILRILANKPEKEQFLSLVSEIASLPRGTERLENSIRALYQTRCANCRALLQADGFLWKRTELMPYARVYHCNICGDEGERLVTEEDLNLLQPLQRGEAIHRGRAMSRALQDRSEDRLAVEDALKVYNARALYVLFTLLNKLEGMLLTPERQMLADALMISLLDAGTSLWSWPGLADRPRQLTLPAVYFEKNLWMELERCMDIWSQPDSTVEITNWPNLPANSGICLYPGPVRNLDKIPAEIEIGNLICLPPRPNQAFWTLSALWSSWLWDKEVSTTFSQVLGRRRFDWHWHTLALNQALEKAAALTSPETSVFIQIEETPDMVYATTSASIGAGLRLTGVACKSSEAPVQMTWQTQAKSLNGERSNPQSVARESIRSLLLELGEPTYYLNLFTAVVSSLATNYVFPTSIKEFSQEKSSELQGIVNKVFGDLEFLRRYEATSQEFESGKWGLVNWEGCQSPLSDRVEHELVKLLRSEPLVITPRVSQVINSIFPGFLTPSQGLMQYCLAAYADWNSTSYGWELREKEGMEARQADLQRAHKILNGLGRKLGYSCSGEQPLIWKDQNNIAYRFFFAAEAKLSEFVCSTQNEEIQSVLVFPGSRAALLQFKLLHDPRLKELSAQNWHFLKLRALFSLAARGDLTRAQWAMQLDSDPINLEETTQLRMFG